MNSTAQSNTFWIVIGAIIALVVLVVLLVMFTGKTGALEDGLMNCESKGGNCYSGSDCAVACDGAGLKYSSVFTCSSDAKKNGKTCCCLGAKSQ